MTSKNCGLLALQKIVSLKTTSMLTLIHLAKDNGVNLYFCKVEPEELVKVARPAIFHQEDHFVYIEDGQPIPPGKYDGYVLTPKPIKDPLPHSLARQIRGQKSGGGVVGKVMGGVNRVLFGKPPKLNYDPVKNYQQASQIMAQGGHNPMLDLARKQITSDMNQTYDENFFKSDTGYQTIQKNKQKAIDSVMAQYANYGQDPYTSTQAQAALTEINNQYDQAGSEYMQTVELKRKQQALANSMEQGRFDYDTAMELATQMGRKAELEYAIRSNDYNRMQNVVGGILTAGVGMATGNPMLMASGASSMFGGGGGNSGMMSSMFGNSQGFAAGNVAGTGFMGSRLGGSTQSQILGYNTGQYRNTMFR